MNDPAFILFWDTSAVGDDGVTAQLMPFPGSAEVTGWKHARTLDLPEHIYFEANVRSLRRLDYPDNDVSWPIMSERMRAILLMPNAPEHRVIPVTMLDDTVPTSQRFESGEPRPGVAVDGFAAVQILERTDAMDMEASDFVPDTLLPGRALKVRRLVLRDIDLPPIFRLSAYPGPLLVSRSARERLEDAGISGCAFWPLAKIL